MAGQKLALVAALALSGVGAAPVTNPEQYVNILTGTQSRYDLSHGNILPSVVRPWGFNAWAPNTDDDSNYGSWWFHPSDARFFGIRCTKQPSPWISDYGQFRINAVMVDPSHSDDMQYSSYNSAESAWLPYYFNATLYAYSSGSSYMTLELTSTNHGAVMRIRYPPYVSGPTATGFNQTRRILVSLSGQATVTPAPANGFPTINGVSTSNSGGVAGPFGHYFTVQLAGGEAGDQPLSSAVIGTSGGMFSYIDLDPTNANTDTVIIRIATSLISADQAALNFNKQVANRTFDAVAAEAQAEWRALLLRATVEDVGAAYYTPEEQTDMLTTFYSALYRSSQFPRFLFEYDAAGNPIHWSPYDVTGKTYPGPLVADSGFWDAYRTVYPWLAIFAPEVYSTMVQGWVNAYQESGWLPKWASPGHRSSMVGTLGDISLADAIVKNIPGINVSATYEAIRKDAFVMPPAFTGNVGRTCLGPYLAEGAVPNGAYGVDGTCSEVVSRSLNYMLSDFAISKAAEYLGYTQDAQILAARAANYSLLFEPKTAFMRSRSSSGGGSGPTRPWTEPFDEFAWGGDYTEAGPWQYRFYVPHDPQGLAKLYAASGLDMCDEIEKAQTMASTFHVGGYGSVIHEQTEMAVLCWGQYEHDNQPVHHMLWVYAAADNSTTGRCASRAQFWQRQVTSLLYRPGADYAVGDEDNGQLSTWYLLTALGLYSLAPGTNDLLLGSPLFTSVAVALPNNKTLRVAATGNCPDCYYVTSVSWNGVPITGNSVDYNALMRGGTLQFAMSDTPPSGVRGGPNKRAGQLKAEMRRSRPVERVIADFL